MIIETRGLSKKFGRFEAIEDLNLRVPEGSVFALIGPNGAGKTTTIRLLMNILRADDGESSVLGTPSHRLAPKDFEHIGYVSESQKLPEGLSLAHYFEYLRSLYPPGIARSKSSSAISSSCRPHARSNISRMACASRRCWWALSPTAPDSWCWTNR
jgi:ABC-type multidrug transport system ATPase subunit